MQSESEIERRCCSDRHLHLYPSAGALCAPEHGALQLQVGISPTMAVESAAQTVGVPGQNGPNETAIPQEQSGAVTTPRRTPSPYIPGGGRGCKRQRSRPGTG